LERLQALLAAGFPVIVEKGFILAENDGGEAGPTLPAVDRL
jgi:hypothetical protein